VSQSSFKLLDYAYIQWYIAKEMVGYSVSQQLFVELIRTIKIAVIIYHYKYAISSAAEKTNITII